MAVTHARAETGLATSPEGTMNRGPLLALLTLFFVLLMCVGLLQVRAGPPPEEAGPLDRFDARMR